jgi:hypothetical protein
MNENRKYSKRELPMPSGISGGIERPTAEQLRRFREHLDSTGDPSTFPGVVPDKPPPDAPFEWLTEEIVVPVQRNASGVDLPCPWCSPTKPKFKKGRLLWFPLERVMRFVGHRCARTHLDIDLQKAADDKWKEQRRRESTNAFLRANCRNIANYLDIACKAQEAAKACDQFHAAFMADHSEVHSDLSKYVRDGTLKVDQSLGSGARRDGQTSISVVLGVIRGRCVLKNTKPNFAKKLDEVIRQLRSIAPEADRARFGELGHLTVQQRFAFESIIKKAHQVLWNALSGIDEYRLFLLPDNIELLNSWCWHEHSEVYACGISIEIKIGKLVLGFRGSQGDRCSSTVAIPPVLHKALPELTPLEKPIRI